MTCYWLNHSEKITVCFLRIFYDNYKITSLYHSATTKCATTYSQLYQRPPPRIMQQLLVGQDLFNFEASRSHSICHITLDRASLAEVSARRRELYLTTRNIYRRQTFINTAVFEPAILGSQRPQTQASNCATPEIGLYQRQSEIIRLYWQANCIRSPNEENTSYTSVSQILWDRGLVNPFFITRGSGPNKFTCNYLPKFLSSYVKLT